MVELIYGLYLLIAISMTVWVARTLSTNGEVFLVQCFGQNEQLAKSTNHLPGCRLLSGQHRLHHLDLELRGSLRRTQMPSAS